MSVDESIIMTDAEEDVFDSVEDIHSEISSTIERVKKEIPSSCERSLVITKLQEADMWLSYVPLS